MKKRYKFLILLFFILIVAIILIVAGLYQPASERLHGTFENMEAELRLVLFEEQTLSNEGKFMIYPSNYPYKEYYIDDGTFYLNEKGIIEFRSTDGNIFYGDMKKDTLRVYDTADFTGNYTRVNNAAIF